MTQVYSQAIQDIFDEWLKSLEQEDGFDEVMIEKLRTLVTSGDVQSQSKIKKFIDNLQVKVKYGA